MGIFYSAGGLAVAAVALLGAPWGVLGGGPTSEGSADSGSGRWLLLAVALVAVCVGGAVTAWRDRLTHRWAHVLATGGTGLITTAVLAAPSPGSALVLAALYGFVVIESVAVFSPRYSTPQVLGSVLAAAAGLSSRQGVALGEVLVVVVALLATAAVVGVLAREASDARVDDLTGLPNRRGLDEAFEVAAAAAARAGLPLAVGLLDLDGFGSVNDELGHEAGDRLLRETARAWRAALPADVTLARLGGDEFAVLLPGRSAADAAALLGDLCADARRPASAGVADTTPEESRTDALRRADNAMYHVKATGRGRCAIAGRDLPDPHGSAVLLSDLASALRSDGLDVVYQPIRATPATTGFTAAQVPLVGAEALVRWTHPVHGTIGPDVFVPLAERAGLIGQLGQHVLRRACQDFAALPDAAARRLRVGVNVSGLELADPTYPGRVHQVLQDSGWPAELLILEVTESAVEADSAAALTTLHELTRLGVELAVDDFGTGFSALGRLDDIGAQYLKLDASLTATVHTSPRRARLVRAAAAMARSLDMTLVAEGVETIEQAHVLAALGCPLLQGYHLGRPGPLESLARRIDAEATHPLHTPLPLLGPPPAPAPRPRTPGRARPEPLATPAPAPPGR
ncbi:bifunctional diguanylate cyclase/phosphodiesterase [uncultured Pseudokineococcus sp.]|uniref:putative bifunctional diguanylate cyclase/phosphodiesterase n=1 Tax=uncultured Pseudokineococcus sp. TaxID=1642928 RepID=UPI00262A6527|nr:bifunctional diguanylate cyclase/phosphodiesterase [uncultured Pseudokineococcus sp.]